MISYYESLHISWHLSEQLRPALVLMSFLSGAIRSYRKSLLPYHVSISPDRLYVATLAVPCLQLSPVSKSLLLLTCELRGSPPDYLCMSFHCKSHWRNTLGKLGGFRHKLSRPCRNLGWAECFLWLWENMLPPITRRKALSPLTWCSAPFERVGVPKPFRSSTSLQSPTGMLSCIISYIPRPGRFAS